MLKITDSYLAMVISEGSFTRDDIFRKAAQKKSLELQNGSRPTCSKPIKVYKLNNELLKVLAEQGIKQQNRDDGIFTLVDENPQEKVPGFGPSNYWNFKRPDDGGCEFDLRIALSVSFEISIEKRGVVFWPQAHGPLVSPSDRLPNFRMFRALVEQGKDFVSVVREIGVSDGSIIVTWTDLGFGGIRKLTDLFAEFIHGNEAVNKLGGDEEIFNPTPYLQRREPANELFIIESAQPSLFKVWSEQLNKYRDSLVV